MSYLHNDDNKFYINMRNIDVVQDYVCFNSKYDKIILIKIDILDLRWRVWSNLSVADIRSILTYIH
jgi:hypothetical protein